MVDMLFIAVALVLFTIGFRLVKRGRPHTRTGGDLYTRRRMRRMLGWMMWTVAGVLVLLTIIDEIYSGPPNVAALPRSVTKPEIAHISTGRFNAQYTPNLLSIPPLRADTSAGATNASPQDLRLTSIPLQNHGQSMIPTLMNPPSTGATASDTAADATQRLIDQAPPPAPEQANVSRQSTAAALAADPTGQKALDIVNAALERDPTNVAAYVQRANVYGAIRKWDLAKLDFQHALRIQSSCIPAQYGLAEVDFTQGQYAAARPQYVALEQDDDYGDISKYKVFLCDLFSGKEDAAGRELAIFNQVGSEASYYFANIAWSLYHKKPTDAQNWWQSAIQIFPPEKVHVYAQPLFQRGYIKVAS